MSSQRSHLLRLLVAVLCALAVAVPAAQAGSLLEKTDRGRAHVVQLGAGAERHRFALRRPAGVVLLFRLTLPRGTRAYLTGRIGSVAGVGLSSSSRSCRERGGELVCEQEVGWCPLPRGTWGFRLHKLSGPAGSARLEFHLGAPPT